MSLTKDKIRLLTFTLDLQTAIAQKTQQNLIFRYEAIEHGTPEPPIWTSPGKFFARVIKAITWLKLEWWVVYEWTNFVLLIVITSQSNPLNWCWYSNSRKKKLKGQWRRLRCSKDFSAFAAGSGQGFDFPSTWTRNTAHRGNFHRSFAIASFLDTFCGKFEVSVKISFNCMSCLMFCRAARRSRPCNILKIRARMRSVFVTCVILLMCFEIEALCFTLWIERSMM